MAKVKAVPEGLHTVTPHLRVDGAAEALELYARALGAEEMPGRALDPSGTKVWHAMVKIGDSMVFVSDAAPEMGAPAKPASLWVYAEDVDGAFARASAAGLKAVMPPMDMFWGDRMAKLEDRWGNEWNLATHVKDMTPEEQKQAADEFVAKMNK
jgi:uncharacterized glyoxalase superfamily protein PhnB